MTVFLLGLFTTICSIMRMVQIITIAKTGNSTMLVLWGTIEMNVGVRPSFLFYMKSPANPPPDLTHMHSHPGTALHLLQRKDILLHPRRQPRTNQWKRQCDAGPEVRAGPRERRTLARPRQHQRHEQPEGDSGDRQQRRHSEGSIEGEERRDHGHGNSGCQGRRGGGARKRRVPPRGEVDIDVIKYLYIIAHSRKGHSGASSTRYEKIYVYCWFLYLRLNQTLSLPLSALSSPHAGPQPRLARGRITSLSRVSSSAVRPKALGLV